MVATTATKKTATKSTAKKKTTAKKPAKKKTAAKNKKNLVYSFKFVILYVCIKYYAGIQKKERKHMEINEEKRQKFIELLYKVQFYEKFLHLSINNNIYKFIFNINNFLYFFTFYKF